MLIATDRPAPVKLYRSMHKKMLQNQETHSIILDLKVIENPVLVEDDNYNNLRNRIKLYNRKLLEQGKEPIDSYETEMFNRLYRILGEINAMTNKTIQLDRLKVTKEWLDEQEKVLSQRKEQGVIRYKADKRRGASMNSSPERYEEPKTERLNIPSEILATTMLPYNKKWRSAHQEHGIPTERIKEFKRKILNIPPMLEQKTLPLLNQDRSARVLYPRPVKPPVQEQTKQQDKIDQENKEQVPGQLPPEGNAPEQNQQPMLGEEPQQPEQPEQPEDNGQDKLAPKNKLYIDPIKPPITTRIPNDIEAKGTFMYADPDSAKAERTMEIRFKKIQDDALLQLKEDEDRVQAIDNWGKGKSKMSKQLQKRLELLALQPSFKYTEDEKPQPYRLPQDEQKKFYLSSFTSRRQGREIDLSLQLPRLRSNVEGYEKSVEKSKLKDLKKRFGDMLNLSTDIEERQLPKSICQYSSRFKSFSSVLEQHSVEKQRQIQLEQVRSIKQKLTKNKVGVNVTTLAHGLCLPEYGEPTVSQFPSCDLPKNPFMVQKKKKKKK